MDKVLSIIIPTYNMSEFLGRCLDSLTPIKNIDRLDVIIVNDGSVDNSLEIANRYVTSFPESFRVIDKSNGNYGSCINAGLEQATGKYVKVLDADDFYDTPSLESFIATMADIDADLIVTDFVRVYSPSKTKRNSFTIPANVLLSYQSYRFHPEILKLWMHAAAYRTELLKHLGYRQTEGISYTDVEWTFLPMCTIQTLYYLDMPLYQYVLGREGQTVSPTVMREKYGDNIKCTCSMILAYKKLLEQHDSLYTSEENRLMLNKKLLRRIKTMYKYYLVMHSHEKLSLLTELDDTLRDNLPELYRLSGRIVVSSPLLPFHYVSHWRNSGIGRKHKLVTKLYRMMKHRAK